MGERRIENPYSCERCRQLILFLVLHSTVSCWSSIRSSPSSSGSTKTKQKLLKLNSNTTLTKSNVSVASHVAKSGCHHSQSQTNGREIVWEGKFEIPKSPLTTKENKQHFSKSCDREKKKKKKLLEVEDDRSKEVKGIYCFVWVL